MVRAAFPRYPAGRLSPGNPLSQLQPHESQALAECREAIPAWRDIADECFAFTPPKGFSSFTMGIRHTAAVGPPAVLYRRLEGKENALLDFEDERRVYLALDEAGIAAHCLAYERTHRIEAFYEGRTLTKGDLTDTDILAKIGEQIGRLHGLSPSVPAEPFFERLFRRWSVLARATLVDARDQFPANEREMCAKLMRILEPQTLAKVLDFVPSSPLHFAHNDVYHGNAYLLESGEVRLLDFEFACLNHPCFDFSNLFAETQMRHGLEEYPHFAIGETNATRERVAAIVDGYLASGAKEASREQYIEWTFSMLPLSDFMYAMAALPLAVEPIQKIRFIPYSLARFAKFEQAWACAHGPRTTTV